MDVQQQQAYDLRVPARTNELVGQRVSGASSMGVMEMATQMLGACDTCLLVQRLNGYDMSFRRLMERKCPRCAGPLVLPQEIMEMMILYGHFIPEHVAATVLLTTIAVHPSLRADYVATTMNELLIPLQTAFVYDVALPKRREGLGMSLRMHRTLRWGLMSMQIVTFSVYLQKEIWSWEDSSTSKTTQRVRL